MDAFTSPRAIPRVDNRRAQILLIIKAISLDYDLPFLLDLIFSVSYWEKNFEKFTRKLIGQE